MCVCQWEGDKVVSMCGAHYDAARREYQGLLAQTQELKEALRGMIKLIGTNELVRNTTMDHQGDWWKRMVEFVSVLKKAQELVS